MRSMAERVLQNGGNKGFLGVNFGDFLAPKHNAFATQSMLGQTG